MTTRAKAIASLVCVVAMFGVKTHAIDQLAEYVPSVISWSLSAKTPIKVLFIYDSADLKESAVIDDLDLRKYLDAHCLIEDGIPARRFLDKSSNLEKMAAEWATMKAKLKTPTGVVIEKGSRFYQKPLPTTAAEALSFLKTYGGE